MTTSFPTRLPRGWMVRGWVAAAFSVMLTSGAQAQDFTYSTNVDTITITGYVGPGGAVTIPSTINGLPVTAIAEWGFRYNNTVTGVAIPESVTNIAVGVLALCSNLQFIAVQPANTCYSSLDGVLLDKEQTTLLQYPGGRPGNYVTPGSVTRIGDRAFAGTAQASSITVSDSVTNVGESAFLDCKSAKAITLGTNITSIGRFGFNGCQALTSITIPEGVTDLRDGEGWVGGVLSFCYSLTNVTFGSSLTNIGTYSFVWCGSLSRVYIPKSVIRIGPGAFQGCSGITSVYFQGDAPNDESPGFGAATTIYYLPGTKGWGATFSGCPTRLWNPQIQTGDANFGVRQNQFGFTIGGTSDIPLLIEAAPSLTGPAWVPLQTCTLTNGEIYFSDPQWVNYPGRFYRIRSP